MAGKFRVDRLLGVGGMGAVYGALHLELRQNVALKMLLGSTARSPMVVERFRQEANESREITHPNVVSVRDFGRDADGSPYLEMEMLQGQSLEDLVAEQPLPFARAVALVVQALDGLSAAHARGTVHRDLKPANLFLHVGRDGREVVKVLDFGIAKVVSDLNLTGDRALLGTPLFMSPEQTRGANRVDPRADLYSMGAVMFYLLTRCTPVEDGALLGVLLKVSEGQIERDIRRHRPDAPAALASAVERALQLDPERRFQSADEMKSALLASIATAPAAPSPQVPTHARTVEGTAPTPTLLAPDPPVVIPTPPRPPEVPAAPRWPWVAAAGAAALCGVLGLTAWKRLHEDAPSPEPTDVRRGPTEAPTRAEPTTATAHAEPAHAPAATAGTALFSGGSFTMGTPLDAVDAALAACAADGCRRESLMREVPARTVTVAAFALDQREVTAGDFARFLQRAAGLTIEARTLTVAGAEQTLSYAVLDGDPIAVVDVDAGALVSRAGEVTARPERAALPMSLVTWYGARRYCRSLAGRLPTEAEWEYAARGAAGRERPWGDAAPTCDGVVFARLGAGVCHGVGAGPLAPGSAPQDRSPEGVLDLGGNVAEWTDDAFLPTPPTGEARVVRGGSFAEPGYLTRGAGRGQMVPARGALQVGFRCAR